MQNSYANVVCERMRKGSSNRSACFHSRINIRRYIYFKRDADGGLWGSTNLC